MTDHASTMQSKQTSDQFKYVYNTLMNTGESEDKYIASALDEIASNADYDANLSDMASDAHLAQAAADMMQAAMVAIYNLAPNDAPVVLPHGFSETERGHNLFIHAEEPYVNSWLCLDAYRELWLEIALRPCNYPALSVQTIVTSAAKLAEHINAELGGEMWIVHKCNLLGVNIVNGRVA